MLYASHSQLRAHFISMYAKYALNLNATEADVKKVNKRILPFDFKEKVTINKKFAQICAISEKQSTSGRNQFASTHNIAFPWKGYTPKRRCGPSRNISKQCWKDNKEREKDCVFISTFH